MNKITDIVANQNFLYDRQRYHSKLITVCQLFLITLKPIELSMVTTSVLRGPMWREAKSGLFGNISSTVARHRWNCIFSQGSRSFCPETTLLHDFESMTRCIFSVARKRYYIFKVINIFKNTYSAAFTRTIKNQPCVDHFIRSQSLQLKNTRYPRQFAQD